MPHTKRPTEWRPCCGNCRSERLVDVERARHPGDAIAVGWRCQDCSADWDGSELTVEEAADRPPRAPGAASAAPDEG